MKKTIKEIRTVAPGGDVLTDVQLQLVTGGMMARSWDSSASVTEPGVTDTAQDWVND